ncbi:MAG: hypothetical protein WA949_07395 [Phormidesmis sp.]
MSRKVSITLDDDVLAFVDQIASNRSSFINQILWREKQNHLKQKLEAAYIAQNNGPEFQVEVTAWDITTGDGLDA